MHILGLPTDIFNVYPASIKYKTYQARWQIGDIYVSGDARKTEDNPQGLGCYLVMTGRGCDDIFRILDSRNCTFGDMFKHCERRYGQDNFHFTRLDIAIDDKNEKPFFTIEQIKKKCEKEEFISNREGYHFDESKFDDFDTAKTVYIGADVYKRQRLRSARRRKAPESSRSRRSLFPSVQHASPQGLRSIRRTDSRRSRPSRREIMSGPKTRKLTRRL